MDNNDIKKQRNAIIIIKRSSKNCEQMIGNQKAFIRVTISIKGKTMKRRKYNI